MRIRMLAVSLAAALALAGCGTDGGTDDVTDTGTEPVTATPTPAETATPDDAATPDEDASPDPDADADTDADAAGDPIARAVDATLAEGSATFDAMTVIDTSEGSDRLEANGVVDFDGDQRQMDIPTDAGSVQALATADGVLMSLGEGAGWVRVDPRELQGTPLEGYGLTTLPLQDPSVNLALLRGATDDVTEAGEEDVDGTTTTRYEVTVDVEAAAQADPEAAQALDALGAGAGETIDMQVWIDEEDRIRRIEHTTDLDQTEFVATEDDLEGTLQVTVEMTDFGEPVELSEPDEGDIVDVDAQTLEQLLSQVMG